MKTQTTAISPSEFSWSRGSKDNWFAVGYNQSLLPAGVYVPAQNQDGSYTYYSRNIKTDTLICFADSLTDTVTKEIEVFWSKASVFADNGFLQRRGYLFYGPPGSGKTAMVEQITRAVIANDGIAFLCSGRPAEFVQGLAWFRTYEPTRPIVCLFEDIDAIISHYGDTALLSCLDGETQVNHVLNIATTNYPEKLDARIINRPRRFDRVIRVGFPPKSIRSQYFAHKLKISGDELDKWVKVSDNFSFAACTDLVISVTCFGYDLDDSAAKVRKTLMVAPNSGEFKSGEAENDSDPEPLDLHPDHDDAGV